MTTIDDDNEPVRPAPVRGSAKGETLPKALTRLRESASGVGFIYQALELVATRFGLDDVVVVFQDEHVGTQIFRLGRESVSPDRFDLVNASSGVYCEPAIVSTRDKNVLFRSCSEELANSGQRRRPALTGAPVDDAVLVSAKSEHIQSTKGIDLADDDLETWTPEPLVINVRRILSQLFVLVDVATIVLVLFDVHGPMRFVFGLLVGIAIPGWSIVGLVKLENAPLELALTLTVSFAIIMVSAQILMFVHWWHLAGFEVIVCLLCLPSLLLQARRPPVGARPAP